MVEESVARNREQVLANLRGRLTDIDLERRARELGAGYDRERGELVVEMLGRELRIDADLRVRTGEGPVDYEEEVILLNALRSPGMGGSPEGRGATGEQAASWVTFREITAGHAGDFAREVEAPLAAAGAGVVAAARQIADVLDARIVEPVGGSDLTLEARLFPGVHALLQVYLPDMEFPADARVLFSAGAERFVPPGCLEELAHRLVERIVQEAEGPAAEA